MEPWFPTFVVLTRKSQRCLCSAEIEDLERSWKVAAQKPQTDRGFFSTPECVPVSWQNHTTVISCGT